MIANKRSLTCLIVLFLSALLLNACGAKNGKAHEEGFIVFVNMPQYALSQGQRFTLELSLQNYRAYNEEIETITLPAVLVQSMNLLGTQPAMPRSINSNGDWIFEFNRTIAPQGSEPVSFRFETVNCGAIEAAGEINTRKERFDFDINLVIVGANPLGWKPGPAKPISQELSEAPITSSVVRIDAVAEVDGQRMLVWSGSGAIISPDGLILTGSDVVLSDRFLQITELIVSLTVDPEAAPVPSYFAGIVQADTTLGLAVLKPHTTMAGKPLDYALMDLPAIQLGDSQALAQGETLQAVGYPKPQSDEPEKVQKVSVLVNDFGSEFPFGDRVLIHASRSIAAGFVGAPAITEAGQLVAVPVHKSPITFDPATEPCKALTDGNHDGRIDALDLCHRINLPIDTLRPVHVALPIIEAARRGEVKINLAGHNEGNLQEPGIIAGLDDFQDNRNKWKQEKSAAGELRLKDGMYLFSLAKPNTELWSQVDYAYEDMLIETDLSVMAPTNSGEFGVLCGINGEDRTVFAVSENGYYAIWKVVDGKMIALQDWRYAPQIELDGALRLSARCSAEALEFAVNGTVLTRVVDPNFSPGMTGLYAASGRKGGLLVGFDHFSVSIRE